MPILKARENLNPQTLKSKTHAEGVWPSDFALIYDFPFAEHALASHELLLRRVVIRSSYCGYIITLAKALSDYTSCCWTSSNSLATFRRPIPRHHFYIEFQSRFEVT